jgi:hypothetical protein
MYDDYNHVFRSEIFIKRLYEIEYKGKTIFCLDLSGMELKQKDEFRRLVEEAKAYMRTKPAKSVLTITNAKNTGFDTEVVSIARDYAEHNTPYVKASAIVGISEIFVQHAQHGHEAGIPYCGHNGRSAGVTGKILEFGNWVS